MRDLHEIIIANRDAQIAGFKARFRRAQELLPNGFTLDAFGHIVNKDSGYAVALKSFDSLDALLAAYKCDLANPDNVNFFFGYWKDETGKEFFEASVIFAVRDTAIRVAQKFSQQAIYSFAEKRDVYV